MKLITASLAATLVAFAWPAMGQSNTTPGTTPRSDTTTAGTTPAENSAAGMEGIVFFNGRPFLIRNGRATLIDGTLVPNGQLLTSDGRLVPMPSSVTGFPQASTQPGATGNQPIDQRQPSRVPAENPLLQPVVPNQPGLPTEPGIVRRNPQGVSPSGGTPVTPSRGIPGGSTGSGLNPRPGAAAGGSGAAGNSPSGGLNR